MAGKKRRVRGVREWAELFDRFDSADETSVSFCRREEVPTSSFYRWRAVLGRPARVEQSAQVIARDSAATPRERVPQSPLTPPRKSTPQFIELGSLDQPGAATGRLEIRLDLGGGLSLHVVRG